MQLNLIERWLSYVSPKAALRRFQSRVQMQLATRAYDAASSFGTSDWSTARRSSANAEISSAASTIRDRSRDLVRNSPYATKALNVIVGNTVGAGIVPKIKGKSKEQEVAIIQRWKQWADTTACDRENRVNFYGMQAAALRCIAESGEVLTKKSFINQTAKLQLLEPDFLNISLGNTKDNIQGIWLDQDQNVVGYELYESHPGDNRSYSLKSLRVPAKEIIHTFRADRIGQMRGVPWFHSVATAMKDFADYQTSTIIRQKIAACFTAFITERDGDSLIDPATLKAQREAENDMSPGQLRYLTQGQSVTLASPPGVDQYEPFAQQTLRSIASGLGITYEALTGDYSQSNYSSSRLGHIEFQRAIDMWRWQMLIPGFCDPVFSFFLNWLQIQGVDTSGVSVEWTCPAIAMIDQSKEISALTSEVRAGLKSLPEAIRERGLDPDQVIQETAEFNKRLDQLGLVFDSDPRRLTQQGMNQQLQPSQPSRNGDNSSGN